MSTVVIAYGTTDGQTARIAACIAELVASQGHVVRCLDIKDMSADPLAGTDAVVIGASIHVGRHEDYVTDFVRAHRGELEAVPSAFFSVSLAAHGDPSNAEGYVETFLQDVGWRPTEVAMFAGALLYTRYGFVKRQLMKRIAKDKGLDTDTSRDFDYTDWESVRRFASRFGEGCVPTDAESATS